ncbi:MAG: rhomboid family intramembrane serine protease [Thermodesulfobacteriales bacterium]|jgi:membrane associated rhomboid family serine protease|nr:MAG: rhomboid family intramembrane serine protease [Thermodesulfobacteriales bacterium]
MSKLNTDKISSSFPIINLTLIAVNILIFVHEQSLGEEIYPFIHEYGLIPAKVFSFSSNVGLSERFFPFLSSMFIHGDWVHLIGNMIFLYIFGSNVEIKIGHLKYLAFYILCGFAAALFYVLTSLGSLISMLGASGAISGVLGAYITYFPISEFKNPVQILFLKNIRYIPAAAIIFLWLVIQFLNGIGSIDQSVDTGGVAIWAHIGGFVAGLILARFFHNNKYDFKQKSERYYH